MKALVLEKPAANTLPVLKQMPVPEVGPGEVLVRIHAAALNFREIGWTLPTQDASAPPFIMGGDGAGVVAAAGAGVTDWKPGDRVLINPGLYCGTCKHCLAGDHYRCPRFTAPGYYVDGTFAEYYKLPARNLTAIPAHLSFETASALPIALGTAWNVMITKGQVKPGDSVLIHGIGGGVALFCLQIGAAMGARVIVTSGSDEKLARARALGAAEGINYRTEDLEQRVMALTEGEGVDLVVDGVGKETLITSLKVASKAGRVVRFGAVTGGTEIPSRYLNKTLMFGHMANQSEFDAALRFVANTRLEPVIHKVYPLEEFADAYAEMAQHRQFGKIIFQLAPSAEVTR